LIITNPSNPCGSVFSREHLLRILEWAKEHKLPILADEVYEGMTFGKPFIPLGSLTDEVPVFSVGTASKLFLAPGWRIGWLVIYDKYNRCQAVKDGILRFKSITAHPSHFLCLSIPEMFQNMPEGYLAEINQKLLRRAELCYGKLRNLPGIIAHMPEGSIYMMVVIDPSAYKDIPDSRTFCDLLRSEDGVVVTPAESFGSENGFRIVLVSPTPLIEQCMDRIGEFVNRHKIE